MNMIEQIMVYSYDEYYTAIRKNQLFIHESEKNVTIHERSQKPEAIFYMIQFI